MERLFIRSPGDVPHAADDDAGVTVCGRSLVGAKEISTAQALVFYKDARCATCFPGWATRKGHVRG